MRHKEIEFSVEHASKRDDVWVWRLSIGGEVRTGKTVAKLSFWRSDGSNRLSTGSYGNGMCPRNTASAATMPGNSPAWPQ